MMLCFVDIGKYGYAWGCFVILAWMVYSRIPQAAYGLGRVYGQLSAGLY